MQYVGRDGFMQSMTSSELVTLCVTVRHVWYYYLCLPCMFEERRMGFMLIKLQNTEDRRSSETNYLYFYHILEIIYKTAGRSFHTNVKEASPPL